MNSSINLLFAEDDADFLFFKAAIEPGEYSALSEVIHSAISRLYTDKSKLSKENFILPLN